MLFILSCFSSPSTHPNPCLFSLVWVVSLISSAFSRSSGSGVLSSVCLVGEGKKEKKMKIKWIYEINHLEKPHSIAPPVSPSPYVPHSQNLFYTSSKWWFWVSHHMAECVKAKYSVLYCKDTGGLPRTSRTPQEQIVPRQRSSVTCGGDKTGRRSVEDH